MSSIGLSFNAYAEPNALPGMLELASQFYDDIVMISAPPEGRSNDETIAIAEKWGVRVIHSSIEYGFGHVRTECIAAAQTEWVVIQDADERIHWNAPNLRCEGTDSWNPDTCPDPNLIVSNTGGYDQGQLLRIAVESCDDPDNYANAIQFKRRHWFDFSWKRPTQNWEIVADWQLRCVRNNGHIGYTRGMHESVMDYRTRKMPAFRALDPKSPMNFYFDHYHLYFKPMEIEQRKEDIDTYNRLHQRIDQSDGPQEPQPGTQNHKGDEG